MHEVLIVNRYIEHANSGDTIATEIRVSARFYNALKVTGAWKKGCYDNIPVVLLNSRKDNVLIVIAEKRKASDVSH